MTNIEILTNHAIQSIDDKMRDQKEINWEQRRYEIAKDIYPIACHDMNPLESKDAPAKAAVELADILIAELKKEPMK